MNAENYRFTLEEADICTTVVANSDFVFRFIAGSVSSKYLLEIYYVFARHCGIKTYVIYLHFGKH